MGGVAGNETWKSTGAPVFFLLGVGAHYKIKTSPAKQQRQIAMGTPGPQSKLQIETSTTSARLQ